VLTVIFSSYPDYSGNSKTLYEYMHKTYGNSISLIWVVFEKTSISLFESNKIPYVLYKHNNFEETMNQTKIIFDTHGRLLNDKKEEQIYINLWHGFGPKKMGYLLPAANFASQDKNFFEMNRRKTDYVITSSGFSTLIASSRFNFNAQRILPLGMARCDELITSNGKELLQKLTNTNLKNFKKILLYLPTFRNGIRKKK